MNNILRAFTFAGLIACTPATKPDTPVVANYFSHKKAVYHGGLSNLLVEFHDATKGDIYEESMIYFPKAKTMYERGTNSCYEFGHVVGNIKNHDTTYGYEYQLENISNTSYVHSLIRDHNDEDTVYFIHNHPNKLDVLASFTDTTWLVKDALTEYEKTGFKYPPSNVRTVFNNGMPSTPDMLFNYSWSQQYPEKKIIGVIIGPEWSLYSLKPASFTQDTTPSFFENLKPDSALPGRFENKYMGLQLLKQ